MSTPVSKKWYAVYTRPRWEKKVAESLSKRGVTNYCPLNRVKKQWHDRKKIVLEPLFSSYVFVQVTPQQYSLVKSTVGVINFVHWLGKPAVVREEEINAISSFLLEHSTVQLEKIKVNMHDEVKIVYGPLMHLEGRIVQVTNNTVKVELPSMGYALVAKMNKEHIQPVSKEKSAQLTLLDKREQYTSDN